MWRPCAQLYFVSIDRREGTMYRLTLLALTKTLHDHQYLRSHDVVASIDEVLERHQVGHLAAFAMFKWALEHGPVVAVFVDHEMTAAVSLGEQ